MAIYRDYIISHLEFIALAIFTILLCSTTQSINEQNFESKLY